MYARLGISMTMLSVPLVKSSATIAAKVHQQARGQNERETHKDVNVIWTVSRQQTKSSNCDKQVWHWDRHEGRLNDTSNRRYAQTLHKRIRGLLAHLRPSARLRFPDSSDLSAFAST